MFLEPSAIVFYVDNIDLASQFYQDLLGIKPEEMSPTFYNFKLSKGMNLALKARHTVVPPTDQKNNNGELAFILDSHKKVDELFVEWQAKEMKLILSPSDLPYGYTFVALDLDENRLRVVSLERPS